VHDETHDETHGKTDLFMTWFLYLIECSDGSIYTGVAVDVAARYAAHVSGRGARYTRSHPPRRLLAVVTHADRSAALRAEYAMKRLSRAEKRRFCLRCAGIWQLDLQLQRQLQLNAGLAPGR
jgi:putative endonuclease